MEKMTPEEIQAVFDAYNKAIADQAPISAALEKAMKNAQAGIKDYTDQMKWSMNQLGTSAKRLGEDLKDGKQGSAVFNDALNAGADALDKFAQGKMKNLGKAVGAVVKILTFFATAANEQADALYKANQDLSKIGAAGARGMTEIYENLKEFGYGVGELGDMGQLISQNSVALSNFYGTVAQGAKAMAGVAKGIQQSDLQRQFMNMGYSVNDINKGIGSYISQQSYFGTQQKRTADELKVGAADYLTNMATLSKLTGQSADQMAQQRDEALAIDSFNAALEGMSEADRERQLERYNYLSKIDKDAAVGYANQVSGFVGLGKQSQQLFMTTGGVSNKLAKDNKMGLDQFAQGLADASASTHALRNSQARLGNSDTFLAYGKTQKLANMSDGAVIKAMKDAKEQTAAQAEGADKLTDVSTKSRQSQMSARDAMQDMIQAGVTPVTEAMEELADLIDNIVHPFSGGRKAKEEEAKVSGSSTAMGAADLKASGLKIKEGDVQKEGAQLSPKLLALAKQIQGSVPGFSYFSSFNDKFHNEKGDPSKHKDGLALDFTLGAPPSKEEGEKIAGMLKSMGASYVLDEYNGASKNKTGGHIHAEVKANKGGIFSGPESGYRPNLTMHGDEAIVPLDKIRNGYDLNGLLKADMSPGSVKDGYKPSGVNKAQTNMPPIGTAGIQPDAENKSMVNTNEVDGTGILVEELRTLLSVMKQGARTQRQMAT